MHPPMDSLLVMGTTDFTDHKLKGLGLRGIEG